MGIRGSFKEFVYAMSTGDGELLMEKLLEFNTNGKTLSAAEHGALRKKVDKACDRWVCPETGSAPDGGPISLGDLIGSVLYSLNDHDIVLRGDVANSMMTLGVSEGLVRSLDPEFDVVKSS